KVLDHRQDVRVRPNPVRPNRSQHASGPRLVAVRYPLGSPHRGRQCLPAGEGPASPDRERAPRIPAAQERRVRGSAGDRPRRREHQQNVMESYSVGFDWDLPFRDWHLRAVYQDGKAERTNVFGNRFRVDRAFLAMDAVRHPDTGEIVCRVQLYNPTPEQLASSPAVQGRISSRSAPGATRPEDPGAIPLRSPIGLDRTVEDCVPFNVLGAGNITTEAMKYVMGDPKIGTGLVE